MDSVKDMLLLLISSSIVSNIVLSQFMGLCPFLGVSRKIKTAGGMGTAVIFVITLASAVAGVIYKFILQPLHIEYLETIVFILVIAALVQFVEMFLKKNIPTLYTALGVYLPLIVVNCIILGRAEMFASKNGIVDSALDGLGMGIGFTITLTIMGTIREILGSGTWMAGLGELIPTLGKDFVIQVLPESIDPFTIMTSAPGGFFVFGCMIALINKISKGKAIKKKEFGCAGCPGCGKGACEGKEAAAK